MLMASVLAIVATIATISLIAPLSHQRIRLIATDTSFVETGCYLGTTYVEVLDRGETSITYVLQHGDKILRLSQKGRRRLEVPIESNPNIENLVKIAPVAMRDY